MHVLSCVRDSSPQPNPLTIISFLALKPFQACVASLACLPSLNDVSKKPHILLVCMYDVISFNIEIKFWVGVCLASSG